MTKAMRREERVYLTVIILKGELLTIMTGSMAASRQARHWGSGWEFNPLSSSIRQKQRIIWGWHGLLNESSDTLPPTRSLLILPKQFHQVGMMYAPMEAIVIQPTRIALIGLSCHSFPLILTTYYSSTKLSQGISNLSDIFFLSRLVSP